MKRIFWIIIIVLLGVFPAISTAEMTGKELLENCQPLEKLNDNPPSLTSKESTGIIYCLGYIDSFMDTFSFQKTARIVPAIPYCLPKEKIPKKEFARIVVEYMKVNPEDLDKPASYAIFMGLRRAYPCNEQKESDKAEAASQTPAKVETQSGPLIPIQPDSK